MRGKCGKRKQNPQLLFDSGDLNLPTFWVTSLEEGRLLKQY